MKIIKNLALLAVVCVPILAGCGNTASDPEAIKNERLDKLGNVQVISREDGSGTRSAFAELIGFLKNDEGKPDMTTEKAQIAEDTENVCTLVSENESAIGYLSLGAVPEDGSVKVLKVNGAEPSLEEKTYPLGRTFYLAHSGQLNDLEEDFLTYVHSAGQAVVAESFLPIAKNSSFLSNKEAGTIVIGGSTSVAPLMEKLADAYMKINSNADIVVQASDSSDGLTKAMSGELDFAMSSRELKDYEMELLDYEAIAKDNIVVIVNPENPLEDITIESLKRIFTGEIEKWEDLNQ